MPKYVPYKMAKMESREWPDRVIEKAPIWASVDLRDGNQALVTPMSIEQKLEYFDLLLKIGFKEIELGFPSASQIEFDFTRRLIEEKRVPEGIALQVLCQAREHLIERTFESLKGAKKVIFHLYNSTSYLQRKVTFNMTKAEIKEIAIQGVRMVKDRVGMLPGTDIMLEYSPESFSTTEVDYALEVSEAVQEIWGPTPQRKMILNLPATVESSTPNVHADQIEWFGKHLKHRDSVIISLHTHNDRGTAIAASELGLLAGADRVEGTLFGNGERTGNLDIVTMALNMETQGIDSGLDFSNIPEIARLYMGFTDMDIPPRQPYSGELVFTAFSGSHQDAIKKGLDLRDKNIAKGIPEDEIEWEVPYLPIDPKDLGRTYEAIIRINSQSGKGGVAYVLKERFGFVLPKAMHPEVGTYMNARADKLGVELYPDQIHDFFQDEFVKREEPLYLESFGERTAIEGSKESIWQARVRYENRSYVVEARGKGPIDAFVHSLAPLGIEGIRVTAFNEEALSQGSDSQAVAYIELERKDGKRFWGCAIDPNIAEAGIRAVVCAFNRSAEKK